MHVMGDLCKAKEIGYKYSERGGNKRYLYHITEAST